MSIGILSLLLLCPLSFAINAVSVRLYQTKITSSAHPMLLFQGSYCLLASLLYATGVRGLPSLLTVVSAVSFGCCFFLAVTCSARCYVTGPMSLTSVLVNASMLLPILWSVLFWNEQVTGSMLAGIVFILCTFVLSAASAGKAGDHFDKKWFIFVTVAFLCNGTTAILQKYRQHTEPQGNLFVFPCIGYLVAALLFYSIYFIRKQKNPELPAHTGSRRPLWWLLVLTAGAGSFLGNCLLQILCVRVAAGVLYPVVNGGLCVVTAAASFAFFHERTTVFKLCSIISGVTGIVLLSA